MDIDLLQILNGELVTWILSNLIKKIPAMHQALWFGEIMEEMPQTFHGAKISAAIHCLEEFYRERLREMGLLT